MTSSSTAEGDLCFGDGDAADLSVNICGGEISQGFPGQPGVVFFIEPDLDVIWKNVLSHRWKGVVE